jgi:hypothetical protein
MYYFGCISRPGHYLWDNEHKKLWYGELPEDFPSAWKFKDSSGKEYVAESKIAPNAYGEQGKALLQCGIEGWTCLSFPDRSVDSRPNCVSVFLERGIVTPERMMEYAKAQFPSVVNRFDFEITYEKRIK